MDRIELWHDFPKDRMDVIIVENPGNFLVPHVLDLVLSIPTWNAKVDNYVVSIFDFVDKYLTRDGSILLFLRWWFLGFERRKVLPREP